jgi:hypothetical protein
MNAINLVVPFRYEGMWVFDDVRVGSTKSRLFQEQTR